MTDGGDHILLFGGGGGIGSAMVRAMAARGGWQSMTVCARRPERLPAMPDPRIRVLPADYDDEETIARAVEAGAENGPLTRVIMATGMLHDEGREIAPEKQLRDLSIEAFERQFRVNTIGPALVMKYLKPALDRNRPAVVATLSARVGSISDNAIGGWYAYRAAKAALNMVIRTAAIEIARTHPQAAVIGLHPGTVDTPLSRPFQGMVPAHKLFNADDAAARLLDVIDGADASMTGRLYAYDGSEIQP